MPTVEQVAETLPEAFKSKFDTKFAIVDGSKIFLETQSDLYMQSSTWSEYKQHNTAKFLLPAHLTELHHLSPHSMLSPYLMLN